MFLRNPANNLRLGTGLNIYNWDRDNRYKGSGRTGQVGRVEKLKSWNSLGSKGLRV